jgi:hypothetical protein
VHDKLDMLFIPLAFGDIDQTHGDQKLIAGVKWIESDLDRELGGVFAQSEEVAPLSHLPRLRGLCKVPSQSRMRCAEPLGNQSLHASSDQLISRVTKHLFNLGIGEDDDAFIVSDHHAVRHRVKDDAKLFIVKHHCVPRCRVNSGAGSVIGH